MTRRDVVIYGDINLNIIDGSAVWVVSLAETLTKTNSTVHLVLKATVVNDRLLQRVMHNPRVVIHHAVTAEASPAMDHKEAVTRLEDVVQKVSADVLIVRGRAMCQAAAASPILEPVLWSYITDFPYPLSAVTEKDLSELGELTDRSHRVFMQTAECRDYFEALIPQAAGKTLLMTPTIPDEFFLPLRATDQDEPLSLVYSGKMHPHWLTLQMLDLPVMLQAEGVDATLTMIGDKVSSPNRPWVRAMRAGLADPPAGVTCLGGLTRDEVIEQIARHDVGMSWRSHELDSNLEISTKLLEYAAAGTPPLLNRTRSHEALLGADYPLFLDDDDPATAVAVLKDAKPRLDAVKERAQEAARYYSTSAAAARLESYFRRAEPNLDDFPVRPSTTRVVVASHDLKFAGELLDVLRARPDIELRIDSITSLREHDTRQSQECLEWADVIVCEWACNNAVWYSQHKRPGQRLIVRLHGFELTGPWPADIDIEAVDQVLTVSDHYRDKVPAELGWPAEKVVMVPNVVDVADLDRPKFDGARFTLGLVGIVPFLKRPDRAIDLLEVLLEHDSRFRLAVRGRMPWESPWIWRKPLEQEPYLRFFERIGSSQQLIERVTFSPFGPDMANWLRHVGWVLSPSERESFHLAPAEGMASGALPVFWPREGVEQIFGSDFLFDDVRAMADFIMATVNDDSAWQTAEQKARAIVTRFDIPQCEKAWMRSLLPQA